MQVVAQPRTDAWALVVGLVHFFCPICSWLAELCQHAGDMSFDWQG